MSHPSPSTEEPDLLSNEYPQPGRAEDGAAAATRQAEISH